MIIDLKKYIDLIWLLVSSAIIVPDDLAHFLDIFPNNKVKEWWSYIVKELVQSINNGNASEALSSQAGL